MGTKRTSPPLPEADGEHSAIATGDWSRISKAMALIVQTLADAAVAHESNDWLRAWLSKESQHAERFAAALGRSAIGQLIEQRARLLGLTDVGHAESTGAQPALIVVARWNGMSGSATDSIAQDISRGKGWIPWDGLDDHAVLVDGSSASVASGHLRSLTNGPGGPNREVRLLSLAYESTLRWSAEFHDGAHGGTSALTIRQHRAGGSARHGAGAFSTPDALIAHVLDHALEPLLAEPYAARAGSSSRPRIVDPACGVGRFLVAAGWRLARWMCDGDTSGDQAMREAFTAAAQRLLVGVDIDPVAAALCRVALWLEGGDASRRPDDFAGSIRVANALLGVRCGVVDASSKAARSKADAWCASAMRDARGGGDESPCPELFHWDLEYPGGFDVVIGNPPFLNQLRTGTATDRRLGSLLRERTDGAVRRYADVAAAFLMLALELVNDNGRIGMVLPLSMLASNDGRGARHAVARAGSLELIWIGTQPLFAGTQARACAVVIHRSPIARKRMVIRRSVGSDFDTAGECSIGADEVHCLDTWGPLVADALGLPVIRLGIENTLSKYASATADFRDQYYGLSGAVVEEADLDCDDRADEHRFPKLITSGLIGAGTLHWGMKAARIHKVAWARPRVDAEALRANGGLVSWLEARLVPKVLVATQTRVLHALVDERGTLLPSVPVLTVLPREAVDPWMIAAAICSPVASLMARTRFPGVALTGSAIKLSARQLLLLPAPIDEMAWREGANWFRHAAMRTATSKKGHERAWLSFSTSISAAYGVIDEAADRLIAWWLSAR